MGKREIERSGAFQDWIDVVLQFPESERAARRRRRPTCCPAGALAGH
jgi:hypothetical protein